MKKRKDHRTRWRPVRAPTRRELRDDCRVLYLPLPMRLFASLDEAARRRGHSRSREVCRILEAMARGEDPRADDEEE